MPKEDELSSKLIGVYVRDSANQSIGTIKDIAFNENGIDGYIL
ncbi:PRC-barrel domain-containing protein [Bradyrhizobium icense]|nr:PRC-barrel domain-containing protein [Bradyrhizobium icense]